MLIDGSMEAKLANLSPEQREELLQHLGPRRSKASTLRARGATRVPLSFAQRNLWFMNEVESDRHKYNMVSAYSLRGPLDREALEHALALIVDRHQILKSRFADNGDDPVQELIPGFALAVPLVDLTEAEPAERESRLHELLAAEGRHTFDLKTGPLFRVHLYRLSPNEHVLQLNVHHAIFDGWSKGLLFRELEAAYSAYRRGVAPELPALRLQFGDFATWQRESMDRHIEDQLRYWRDRLSGAPALLNLPTDFQRPPARSSEADVVRMFFESDLLEKLRGLALRCGSTLFMTMLAAFALLLRRCTGQDDICVASPVDNRSHGELRNLIGYFLNTVVLRTRFQSGMTVRDLVRDVRETTLAAFQNQDAPF
ncbi:MAG TPA: condensation domain-containing protein, partial [Polyangiaceae bacterium]